MQKTLNDLTSLAGISGFAFIVVFSIFFLLAVFLLCSWCCYVKNNPEETEHLYPDTPDETPAEREKVFQQQIRKHYVTLGDNLDTDSGLLSILFSKGVINLREKQLIQVEKVDHVRNEKILDQMLKKSEVDFSKFIDALRESNQDHIARILLKDGAALPVHIKIQTQLPVDVKQIELELARQFNEASARLLRGNSSFDELEELMRNMLVEVQQKKAVLLKAVPDKSIVLYFFCSSPETLDNIVRECQKGSFSQCIEKIVIREVIWTSSSVRSTAHGFISPIINADRPLAFRPERAAPIAAVCFRVDDDEYKRCLENFPGVSGKNTRLVESIKLVVYIQRSFKRWRSFNRPHSSGNAHTAAP